MNGDCAGVGLASWTKVSGRPVSVGSAVRLEDIRIDEVEDADTRAVLANLRLSALFPKAVDLDVQSAVQTMLAQSASQIQTTVESFGFEDVSVVNEKLSMKFNFKLVGR